MKLITVEKVKELIRLISFGLVYESGDMNSGEFCVQQAVSRTIHKNDKMDDGPKCVGDQVCSFGIALNDQKWSDDLARGEGMKDFAIAELGSNKISQKKFDQMVIQAYKKKHPQYNLYPLRQASELPGYCEDDKELSELAQITVEVLKELKTEGSKYLYLTHEEAKEQARKKIDPRLFPVVDIHHTNGNGNGNGNGKHESNKTRSQIPASERRTELPSRALVHL